MKKNQPPDIRRRVLTAAGIALSLVVLALLYFVVPDGAIDLGYLQAIVPAAVLKLKKDREKLLTEARALIGDDPEKPNVLDEAGETRFDEITAEVETINASIERHTQLAAMEEDQNQRSGPQTMEGGEAGAAGEPGEPGASVQLDEREKRAYLAHHTLNMMRSSAFGNMQLRDDSASMLVRGGHYGEAAATRLNEGMRVDQAISTSFIEERNRLLAAIHGQEYRAAGDYYSTLINADGAFLLPTVVVQEIEEIAKEVGVLLGLTDAFEHIIGTIRVPGGSGADSRMSFVAEGGEISSRIRSFSAVELNPKKVADIIPWSYEVGVEAGPQVLADIERVMGRSYGFAIDDAGFNGDGTATYNSIDGILSGNRSPGELVMAATEVDFDDITPDELILGVNRVPAGVRMNFTQAFHPDMRAVFKTKKDTNGSYLFDWHVSSDGILIVAGVPTVFSEALPALSASAVSTSFGVGGDFRHLKIALGGGLQTEEMRTGVVKDADTGADINLGTQDLRALKYRAFFDLDTNFDTAFMKYTTAAA